MDKPTVEEIKQKLISADNAELIDFYQSSAIALGDLVAQSVADEEDVYVVGLNYDFDIFAKRYAMTLGEKLVGAASLSSEPSKYPTPDGHRFFANAGLCMSENPVRPPSVIVIFLAVASDVLEAAGLWSFLYQQIGDARVVVATILTSQRVRDYANQWGHLDGPVTEIVSLADDPDDVREIRDRLYKRLEKDHPQSSLWLLERCVGTLPEEIRAMYRKPD
jgi:hypothetical protein